MRFDKYTFKKNVKSNFNRLKRWTNALWKYSEYFNCKKTVCELRHGEHIQHRYYNIVCILNVHRFCWTFYSYDIKRIVFLIVSKFKAIHAFFRIFKPRLFIKHIVYCEIQRLFRYTGKKRPRPPRSPHRLSRESARERTAHTVEISPPKCPIRFDRVRPCDRPAVVDHKSSARTHASRKTACRVNSPTVLRIRSALGARGQREDGSVRKQKRCKFIRRDDRRSTTVPQRRNRVIPAFSQHNPGLSPSVRTHAPPPKHGCPPSRRVRPNFRDDVITSRHW